MILSSFLCISIQFRDIFLKFSKKYIKINHFSGTPSSSPGGRPDGSSVPLAAGSPGPASGGCPWVCEEPCVAEMFQKSPPYYASLDLAPIPGATPSAVPMAFRGRKKGGGAAKKLGEELAGVAEGWAGGRPPLPAEKSEKCCWSSEKEEKKRLEQQRVAQEEEDAVLGPF